MSLFASESINIKYPQAFCTAIDIDQASGVQIINTEIINICICIVIVCKANECTSSLLEEPNYYY